MRVCSQSRGGLLEDVMPLQNINFKASERQKAVVMEGVRVPAFKSCIVFSFLKILTKKKDNSNSLTEM